MTHSTQLQCHPRGQRLSQRLHPLGSISWPEVTFFGHTGRLPGCQATESRLALPAPGGSSIRAQVQASGGGWAGVPRGSWPSGRILGPEGGTGHSEATETIPPSLSTWKAALGPQYDGDTGIGLAGRSRNTAECGSPPPHQTASSCRLQDRPQGPCCQEHFYPATQETEAGTAQERVCLQLPGGCSWICG